MKIISHPTGKRRLATKDYALLFCLILRVCTSVFAEAPPIEKWVTHYNGPGDNSDITEDLVVDNLGNIYVTGYSSGTSIDYATIKYNPDGNELWVACYNGTGNIGDYARAIEIDNAGNVYVTGQSRGTGTSDDYATVKYSPDGNQLWAARYNGPGNSSDYAEDLAIDSLGNVYVTGRSIGNTTSTDFTTVKYNPDGNQLWVARYNGPGNSGDGAYAITVDNSDNVYVTGNSSGSGTGADYTTIKYGPDSNQALWVARYNGSGNDYDSAHALGIDSSGNIYVTGYSTGSSTSYDYTTIKYNSEGSQLWVANYNGPGNYWDRARDLAVDSSGNVYITGQSQGSGTSYDYATVKYNSDSNQVLWVARYNGPGNSSDDAKDMAIDKWGNVYITGWDYGGSGTMNDYATVKYSPDGNQLWVARYNSPENNNDYAYALAVDNLGNVYVTGNGSGTDADYATIKYDQEPFCIYVDANATGANNGSSWENAYQYLQDALAAAEPNSNYEIWVAQGTYRPDENSVFPSGTDDRTATFQLKNDVKIYGGFPIGGGIWSSRNPQIYQTILSGDLDGNDVNVSDPCDLFTEPTRAENSYHVVTGSYTDANTILDGFTITGGNANAPFPEVPFPGRHGGGMFNRSASCKVNNCTFVENSARFGGGIDGSTDSDYLCVTNCTFLRNDANDNGGGIDLYRSDHVVVANCTFIANVGVINGAGGMSIVDTNSTLTNCIFSGNSGPTDGGLFNLDGSNTIITNCTFRDNSATNYGGGIFDSNNSNPIITNCIFWNNSAPTSPQIYDGWNSSATVNYCDIQGGWSGAGAHNIDADPLFVDANGLDHIAGTEDDNLRLSFDSPCIDVGDNISVPSDTTDLDGDTNTTEPIPFDLDGKPRFVDYLLKADTGNGTPPIVDIGAYERGFYIADPNLKAAVEAELGLTDPNATDMLALTELDASNIGIVFLTGLEYATNLTELYLNDNQISEIFALTGLTNLTVLDLTGNPLNSETSGDYLSLIFANNPGINLSYDALLIYVDIGAAGNNDGTSWADAYNYLQDALTATEPNLNYEIWVAQGTYKPDRDTGHPGGTGSRTATFQLKNGVAIYGGFPSGGGSRDSNMYKTILSGDINVPDNNSDNSYHILTGSGTNSTAILDGFTISKGNANGSYPHYNGAGMYNVSGSPAVTNCAFIGNSANYSGGAMFNQISSSPTLTNCIFNGNSADDGGGIRNAGGNPTVINCTFIGNSAVSYGGGIHSSQSNPVVTNCIFVGNSAEHGGGIANWYVLAILKVTNCTFAGNSATSYGGGIYNYENSDPTLANCIVWGNTAPTGPQIYNDDVGSTPAVSYCDVQGGWSGTGNINTDPLFFDADGPDNIFGTEDDNLRLSSGSPCIDAGDNTTVPGGIVTDLDGRPRFLDDPCTSDTGNGTPPIVDMGAYEFLTPTLLAWWKFDDGSGTILTDSSGNGYNGTILGNPTWKTGSQYCGSGYIDFDGVDDYVDVNYFPDAFLFPAQYTVSALFRADGGSNQRDIFSAFDVNEGHGILIELRGSSVSPPGGLRYLHRHPFSEGGGQNIYTTTGYSDGLWHHVAVVRESDTSRLVYVDGQMVASDTNATSALDKPVRIFLGQLRPGVMDRWWNGGIDDVRIYNRGLSPEEISHLIPPPIQNIDTGATYDTIQAAIEDANNGETIVVQPGTYTGEGNAGINFYGKAITLRSAEPNDPNTVAATIIDCNNNYAIGVYFQTGEETNSVLNGFTIADANAEIGGGVFCSGSSPTIKNCILRNNTAEQGGGIYCQDSNPTIYGGTIRNNSPAGIYIDADSSVLILGVVHIISNDIVGDGTVQMGPGGSLDLDKAKVFTNMSGPGTVTVAVGAEATIDGNSIINLGDPYDPNIKGTINSEGFLKVKENAQIISAKINVTRVVFEDKAEVKKCEIHVDSKAPYGTSVFADPNISFVDVNIYADGDRYMDLDPSIFDGNFVNVKIFVTITEGVGQLQGGLLECRGDIDIIFADVNSCDPNNTFFCRANPGTIPDCNIKTWTLERLELIPGAKLNLTNRFPFQPPYNPGSDYDVVYVKELILREGAVLNTSFNHIYYDNLIKEPNAVIKNEPLLGFSMINIALDNQTEFIVRVTPNNYTDYNEPNHNRVHIERVEGLSPDPNGMMRMSNLLELDPCSPDYNDIINARAKGLFSKSNEDEILILFEYLFGAVDPNTELVIYLSDIPELGDVNDTNDYIEVARLIPPLPGQAGSVGSGRFGVFKHYVSTGGLNFIRGTRIEFMLLGGNGVYMYINNWDPQVHCTGICLDLNFSDTADEEDFLIVSSHYGTSTGSPAYACLEGPFGEDGTVDSGDICGWDWALNSIDRLNCCGVPLTGGAGASGSSSAMQKKSSHGYKLSGLSGDFNDILVCGKRGTDQSGNKMKDALYVFDSNGQYLNKLTPPSNRANIRLVEDFDKNVHLINSEYGIRDVNSGTIIVWPAQLDGINEPRYGTSATVYVGVQGAGDNSYGRPISDAAFDPDFANNNCVYIVPVVVEPHGEEAYVASAKLQLSESSYSVIKLYDDPDANMLGDNRNLDALREVEIDTDGNLYVLNAYSNNESDILWKYNASSGMMIERLVLGNSISVNYVPSPSAMYLSTAQDMLYLASSLNPTNANSSTIYGFSTSEPVTLARKITVNGMGHVTAITEDPTTGTLWVAGFIMEPPEYPNPDELPFYDPYLAEVPIDSNNVNAICTLSSDPNNDLALPLSIVWTGAIRIQEKCDGTDLDSSGDVDLKDFSVFAQHWYENGCVVPDWCGGADLDPYIRNRGQVDLVDLAIFVKNWLDSDCLE